MEVEKGVQPDRSKKPAAKYEDDVSEPLSLGGSSSSASSRSELQDIELCELGTGSGHGVKRSRGSASASAGDARAREDGPAGPRSSPGASERANTNRDLVLRLFHTTLTDITGEFAGTFFLTLVICTSVATSVVAQAGVSLLHVALVCGIGVAVSIYCTSHVSEAHLNPAVTLAFALVRPRLFSWRKVAPYVLAQMLGGVCAGAVLYAFYRHAIAQFEETRGLARGEEGSELTAMMFGEYFPNPSMFNHSLPEEQGVVSAVEAMFIEAWGTGILVFVIFCLTDKQNTTVGGGRNKVIVPLLVGATISLLISLYAPLTQAGWNPARDFGPRIFAALAGWGRIAIPGPRNGFWVYIVGPLLGGPLAASIYDFLVAQAVRLAKKHSAPPSLEEQA